MSNVKPKSTPLPASTALEAPNPDCLLGPERQKLYMAKLGTCNYLATQTRGDIAAAVSKLGAFMQQADEEHMKAIDHVLAYLAGTPDVGLTYRRSGFRSLVLRAYSDASFADKGQTGDGRRRSHSGRGPPRTQTACSTAAWRACTYT